MTSIFRRTDKQLALAIVYLTICLSCGSAPEARIDATAAAVQAPPRPQVATAAPVSSPSIPNLQKEILDAKHTTTSSPIGDFDFKNFSYPMPRGWENPDGSEIALVNGRVKPLSVPITEDMSDEEKAARRAQRRIGLSYVTTKFLELTGDGQDEAVVVLKVETGGAAIPQIVYVYEWKEGAPKLIWMFRAGDRADGGLKTFRAEHGEFVLELFGQDRFVLGQVETGKITGDEVQLCCPTHFTRTRYRWNGNTFLMQGRRLTYSIADVHARPEENLGERVNAPPKGKK